MNAHNNLIDRIGEILKLILHQLFLWWYSCQSISCAWALTYQLAKCVQELAKMIDYNLKIIFFMSHRFILAWSLHLELCDLIGLCSRSISWMRNRNTYYCCCSWRKIALHELSRCFWVAHHYPTPLFLHAHKHGNSAELHLPLHLLHALCCSHYYNENILSFVLAIMAGIIWCHCYYSVCYAHSSYISTLWKH